MSNDDPRHWEPWERARWLLEAQHAILTSEPVHDDIPHPNDVPAAALERMITDVLHYCHERNKGLDRGDGDYIELDYMVKAAKAQFIREREAIVEKHEPRLTPDYKPPDPEYVDMQDKLYSRQLAERNELEKRQQQEVKNLGPSEQLDKRHSREVSDLTERFEKERERYTSEYNDAKRIAQEMKEEEKQEQLQPTQDKKCSR